MKILLFGYGYYALGDEICEGGTILRSLLSWQRERLNSPLSIDIAVKDNSSFEKAANRLQIFTKKYLAQDLFETFKVSVRLSSELQDHYDGCIVAIPENQHYSILSNVVGIIDSVICVKPLCVNYSQYSKITTLYKNKSTPLFLDLHKRYDESNIAFISTVSRNLSRSNLFKFSYGQKSSMPKKYFQKWSNNSNPFQYLAPHYLDIIFTSIGCNKPELIENMNLSISRFKFEDIDLISCVIASIEFDYNKSSFHILADCNWQEPEGMPYNSRQRIEYIGEKIHYISDQDDRGQLVGSSLNTKVSNPHFMTNTYLTTLSGYGKTMYSNYMDYVAGIYPSSLLPNSCEYSPTAFILDEVRSRLHETS